MRTDGQQIYIKFFDTEVDFSEALHSVTMNERRRSCTFDGFTNQVNRLNTADFIIDEHDTDQNGFIIDGTDQFLYINDTVSVYRKANDLISLFFKRFQSVINAWVFNTGGDDSAALMPVFLDST
ncbi:hypothetical protein SDC9_136647 [bioreactor metagenome]|uniref:Uncharacterized protein n=1 Tax=bioreactor metagenome TaxID=1076179 RepID=A0A645DKE5_9ZZZZ